MQSNKSLNWTATDGTEQTLNKVPSNGFSMYYDESEKAIKSIPIALWQGSTQLPNSNYVDIPIPESDLFYSLAGKTIIIRLNFEDLNDSDYGNIFEYAIPLYASNVNNIVVSGIVEPAMSDVAERFVYQLGVSINSIIKSIRIASYFRNWYAADNGNFISDSTTANFSNPKIVYIGIKI